MTQIEQQLMSKFDEILKEIRTNRESNLANDEEDAEGNGPSTSNSENKHLRRKHASNNEIDKYRNQDNRFQFSEMYELRQPSTPFGVANETLHDTIIIHENRQEADYLIALLQAPSIEVASQDVQSPGPSLLAFPNIRSLNLRD